MQLFRQGWFYLTVFALLQGIAQAASPPTARNLDTALLTASIEGKLLFVHYGRTTNGDSHVLAYYVEAGHIPLAEDYIYVPMDCDDDASREAFYTHFRAPKGKLPFVIIADWRGRQLAARSGRGNVTDFRKLVEKANIQAERWRKSERAQGIYPERP